MKPLMAGELDKRIMLRRVEQRRGPLGEPLREAPVDIARLWAKVEPISDRKIRTAEQQQVIETYQFTLRPRADVEQDWQVVFGQQFFTVRTTDRSKTDRLIITAEADVRHDRAKP